MTQPFPVRSMGLRATVITAGDFWNGRRLGPASTTRSTPTVARQCPGANPGGRPRRAGGRARRSRRSPWSSRPLRPDRSRFVGGPGSVPTCHRPTSDDAGCRPFSNSRTGRADHATAIRYGSARTLRRPLCGDRSTGHPCVVCGLAATAPAEPIRCQSDHDDRKGLVMSQVHHRIAQPPT
jgi:hypothetical protein